MIKKILDFIIAWKQRREYQSNINDSKEGAILTNLLCDKFDKHSERMKHPMHDERLMLYKELIKSWKGKKSVDINFGDSLTDMSRKQIEPIHDGVFSISGSWAHHMQMMVEDIFELLKNSDIEIKNISVGCLGGNPMLVYQDFQEILNDSLSCLNKIRELFPNSKIIVYGIPPVYNIYATMHSYEFDFRILNWINFDKNASFISLKDNFGKGLGKLFPQMSYSSDGVHFNSNGANRFANLIKKEKNI